MVGQPPQQCFLTPLLIGTDGSQKMSKSLGNYIGIAEPPNEIYGKVMSIPDTLILHYFELVTDIPDEELEELRQGVSRETINPMTLKKRLAREIVTQLYNQKAATEAEEHFVKVFQEGEVPEEIEEKPVSFKELTYPDGSINIGRLLTEIGLTKSNSEADRLITQGAVSIDGTKISGNVAPLKSGSIIKVGKRRFAKVINTDIINRKKTA